MKRAFLLILALLLIGGAVAGFVRYRQALSKLVPASWTEPTYTFAVIGDTESDLALYGRALAEAKRRGAALLVHAGDVTASGTAEEFKAISETTTSAGLRVYAAVGNHDIAVDATRGLFTKYLNEPNLAFNDGDLRFVLLDNADRKVGFSASTLAWLKDDIAGHPGARYVVAFHRPFDIPFDSITGDDETAASRATNEELKRILSSTDVAAIFTGHLHTYLPYAVDGVPAYITGGGGGKAQQGLAAFTKSAHHFLLVRLTGTSLHAEMVKLD